MRIAIEALGIERPGGGRFTTLSLILGILQEDLLNDYLIILSSREPSLDDFLNAKQLIIPERNRFLARIKAQTIIPRLLHREKMDIVHFAKNLGVFSVPCKSVVTIFDMTILNYPKFFPKTDVAYWQIIQREFLKSADKIATLSNSAKRDLLRHYELPLEKIVVIYSACDPAFRLLDQAKVERIREKFRVPSNYVLTVGNISPKKNFETLIRAFALLKRDYNLPHKLVFVGTEYRSGGAEPLRALVDALTLEKDTLFLGTIVGEDLVALYNGAALFALPSLDEGYGIVLVEAMSCGTPVIGGNVSATPEIVGDAGILLQNPRDERELADAMAQILTNDPLRRSLIESGLKQAAQFSWRKAGREYIQLYEQMMSEN